jgi:Rieske Fe-S protein
MSYQTILRTLIASGIVVGAVAALSPAAFAVGDNGIQSGNIANIETVDYTAGGTVTITPNAAQTNQDFGSVNVKSNSPTGWDLTVGSLNTSKLLNADTDEEIAYTLQIGAFSGAAGTVASPVSVRNETTLTCAADTGCAIPVKGSIPATESNGKSAGIYSDTLTFTLTNQ